MTARTDYIAHCESLGIHRSLAGLMADVPNCCLDSREKSACKQVRYSFYWIDSEQGDDFWLSIDDMLLLARDTGECK
jgi:hypothetical protein